LLIMSLINSVFLRAETEQLNLGKDRYVNISDIRMYDEKQGKLLINLNHDP
jgi:hypothetical protein